MIQRRSRRYRLVVFFLAVVFLAAPSAFLLVKIIKARAYIWLPTYAQDTFSSQIDAKHVIVLLADHWEPGSGDAGLKRARDWLVRYRPIADGHRDSQGRRFQYTWFYPIDSRNENILALLADQVRQGYGEVEVHLHHKFDTPESFERKLKEGLADFTKFGALLHGTDDQPRFAFVHGNWSLDNSRGARYCGVNRELDILAREGCYVDMTFPAFGTAAQPAALNRLFYAKDTDAPKSYDGGNRVRVGSRGEGLLIFQGVLGIDLHNPLILFEYSALDNSEGSGFSGLVKRPSTGTEYWQPHRVEQWLRLAPRVDGKEEWAFLKLYAHGIQHSGVLLDGLLDKALDSLERDCQNQALTLHYVTAREAYNLVKAAEAGVTGPPERYYDFEIPPPLNASKSFFRREVPGAN